MGAPAAGAYRLFYARASTVFARTTKWPAEKPVARVGRPASREVAASRKPAHRWTRNADPATWTAAVES